MVEAVLIVGNVNFLGNNASANRVNNYCKALKYKGITPYLFPLGSKKPNCLRSFKKNEDDVYYIKNSESFLRKYFFSVLLYFFDIKRLIKDSNGKICVIFYPSIHFSMIIIVRLLQIFSKVSLFIEVNELRTASLKEIIDKNRLKNVHRNPGKLKSFLINTLRLILFESNFHKKVYSDAAGLICISKRLINYYKDVNNNILYIPIITDYQAGITHSKMNKEFSSNDTFKVCYAGTITEKKEYITDFIKTLDRINKNDLKIVFDLYGNFLGGEKQKFLQWLNDFGYDAFVKYKGQVSDSKLLSIYKSYHGLFLLRKNTIQNNYGFSTKIATYLLSGTPVFATFVSDMSHFLTNNKNVFEFYHNPKLFESTLLQVINEYNHKANSIAQQAMKTVKISFDYKIYSTELYKFLNS